MSSRTSRRFAFLVALLTAGCSREPATPIGTLRFEDATLRSGLAFVTTSGATPSSQILEVKGGGLALIDHDGDGDHDLLVPNGATLDSPSKGPGARFFENRGGLEFADATAIVGLEFDRWGFGPCVFDAGGDGREEVFIACYGENAFYGIVDGRFVDATADAGLAGGSRDWSTAAACGDLDADGDLDLYVVNYLAFDPAAPPPPSTLLGVPVFGGPSGLAAQPDRAYRNRGDGTFEDATAAWGFDRVPPAYGLNAIVLDFDLDGRQDVFVGNDSDRNNLFVRRDDGAFEDVALRAGIATNADGIEQATMGIAIGDVDGNGTPDVFTTNFMNDTNTLHVGIGTPGAPSFADHTTLYGLGVVSRPFLGWASAFHDFDHDRDEDLIVFNGHTYPEKVTGPAGWAHRQEPLLFRREGRRFVRVAGDEVGAAIAAPHCDRSAVFDDLDGDGDVDVVVSELNGPLRVLENVGARGPHAIVSLDDRRVGAKNRRGVGSQIRLIADDVAETRWIHGAGSYQAANPKLAHFALPAGSAEYRLAIDWPDGHRQDAGPFPANERTVVARE
jgi:hypothetical protein